MFERLTRRLHPPGWPAEIEVRELVADEVLPLFMNGKPDALQLQRMMVFLATRTGDGEPLFESAEAVGQVPARYVPGLMAITAEVMRMNVPAAEAVEVADDGRPT